MAFQHLDDRTVRTITETLIRLGLTSDQDVKAMTAGISPAFSAQVSGGAGPSRLLTLAAKMNSTRVLVSGQVPLVIWLNNCILLAADQPEEQVFREALERASIDGELPADLAASSAEGTHPADVAAVPQVDGGALEIAIGEDDTLEVRFLHRGSAASSSVAKLLVHRHFGGQPAFLAGNKPDLALGTGWLIAPRLMITNHHVVNARLPLEPAATQVDFDRQGAATKVQFDFFSDHPAMQETHTVGCVASEPALDFALLRLDPTAPDRPPLQLRTAPLTRPMDRELRDRVNVLQHPDGRPMRLGFRNNFVVSGTESRLSYLTDTAGGSSGSPICDDEWFVAALHRGFTTLQGDGVQVWGRSIHQENYGTPIGQILASLGVTDPEIRAEIEAGQAALAAGV